MLISLKQPNRNQFSNPSTNIARTASVHFSGINANFSANTNRDQYVKAFQEQPDEHLLSPSATSIFREFDSSEAVAQILKDKKSTALHILGCSDGSEAYAYGLSAQQQLTKKSTKDPQKIEITGVDIAPDLIGLAKTGYLVCTDLEKERQCQPTNPVAGNKWVQFFERKAKAPAEFDTLIKNYPRLEQITRDPVAQIKIGDGMEWYKVKQKSLPKITFKTDSLEHYVTLPTSSHLRQIYVMANSWGYMMVQNSKNPAAMVVEVKNREKITQFINVIKDLKKNNQNKEVLIVIGDIERQIIENVPGIKNVLPFLGMKPLSDDEMQNAGIQNLQKVRGKIWRLTP